MVQTFFLTDNALRESDWWYLAIIEHFEKKKKKKKKKKQDGIQDGSQCHLKCQTAVSVQCPTDIVSEK